MLVEIYVYQIFVVFKIKIEKKMKNLYVGSWIIKPDIQHFVNTICYVFNFIKTI